MVYAVPQPSLQTSSLASSIDNVSISGQCIISILHGSETGGPVVPISQESNSFKDCGVSPSIISSTSLTTTTDQSNTVTTTSTMSLSPSPPVFSSISEASSASIVSPTSSAKTSAPAGSNAGSPQFSAVQSFTISAIILPCTLAFAFQLL